MNCLKWLQTLYTFLEILATTRWDGYYNPSSLRENWMQVMAPGYIRIAERSIATNALLHSSEATAYNLIILKCGKNRKYTFIQAINSTQRLQASPYGTENPRHLEKKNKKITPKAWRIFQQPGSAVKGANAAKKSPIFSKTSRWRQSSQQHYT